MTAFQEALGEFDARNTMIIAASVDSQEDAQESVDTLGLTFPVIYGLDYMGFSEKTGAFYEVRRSIIHATSFILDADGNVTNSCYGNSPIGRFWPIDCTGVIDFAISQRGK